MSDKRVRRLYTDVTGEERFRLAVAADIRGDVAERDHLIATCPTVPLSVRGPDPAFRRLVEGTRALLDALVCAIGPAIGALEALEASGESVEAFIRAAGEAAGCSEEVGDSTPPKEGRYPLVVMDALHERSLSFLKAVWEAFADACRERAGLEPEVVLAAFEPEIAELLDKQSAAIAAAPVDEELSALAARCFANAWSEAPG